MAESINQTINVTKNTVLAIGCNPDGSYAEGAYFARKVFSARLWKCGFSDSIISGLAAETMERFNIGGTT